jgi:hypothetical protein
VYNAAGIDIITAEMVKELRLTGKKGQEKIYFRLLLGLNDREQELVEKISEVLKGVIEVEGLEIVRVNTLTPTDLGLPRYRLATTVPANWIPFVPAAVGLGVINLQRATMLYNEVDVAPQSIDAMTRLLRFDTPEEPLLSLNEETVLRAGIKVQLTKQRVRWLDGRTYTWLGRKVITGRGEGSSYLKFDILPR